MAQRARARSSDDRGAEEPAITAREAAELARQYIAEMTDREPVTATSVTPTDEGGWLVEVEVIEDRRIPSSSDILALYEVELDADGELLSYRRIRRFLRGHTRDGGEST
jgi:hypothetical protein